MIRKHAEAKRTYSRTYAETSYVPLTMNDKMKLLEDLDQSTDKRLMLYSELFKEIKSQISSLSNNISPPFVKKAAPEIKNFTKNSSLNNSLEEKDEVHVIQEVPINNSALKRKKQQPEQKVYSGRFVKRRSKSLLEFDWRDSDENVGSICVPNRLYNSNAIRNLDNGLSSKRNSLSPSPRVHAMSDNKFVKYPGKKQMVELKE